MRIKSPLQRVVELNEQVDLLTFRIGTIASGVAIIEAKHTKSRGIYVTTHYKAAYAELGALIKEMWLPVSKLERID